MHWKTKSHVFRALSAIPFGTQLHYQLQKRVTREWPRPAANLDQLLVAARRVAAAAQGRHGRFLEIGASRDLAVAVALRLLGVEHVTCVDVSRLAKPALVAHAAAHMAERLGGSIPALRDWGDIERFGIRYIAPTRLQQAPVEPMSFDCFYSVDTLEHIPPDELLSLLRFAKGLLVPGGLCVHCIDYGDHYARSDNGLSRFNFLTYSDRDWRPFNSRFQYVNRLRHGEFEVLFAKAGMKVLSAECDRTRPEPQIVERLAPEYRGRDMADLFTIRAMIVASA